MQTEDRFSSGSQLLSGHYDHAVLDGYQGHLGHSAAPRFWNSSLNIRKLALMEGYVNIQVLLNTTIMFLWQGYFPESWGETKKKKKVLNFWKKCKKNLINIFG